MSLPIKAAIRADASAEIGSGHVMRCLALADALKASGAEVHFLCRPHFGHLGDVIAQHGHTLHLLAEAAPDQNATGHAAWLGTDWRTDADQSGAILAELRPDWLVADHYALDSRWEGVQRSHVGRILVIDDLADRDHECDLLLDQNYYLNAADRYAKRVPRNSRMFLGPQHALLRQEFALARQTLRQRDGRVRRILVCFGGGDILNLCGRSLEAIDLWSRQDIAVDLVAGAPHCGRNALEAACAGRANVRLHDRTEAIAGLMAEADLSVGAGGSMNWERCCLGLPTIAISIAPNQRLLCEALAQTGALSYLGGSDIATPAAICLRLDRLTDDPEELMRMSRKGMELVDGLGTERIARAMLTL